MSTTSRTAPMRKAAIFAAKSSGSASVFVLCLLLANWALCFMVPPSDGRVFRHRGGPQPRVIYQQGTFRKVRAATNVDSAAISGSSMVGGAVRLDTTTAFDSQSPDLISPIGA